MHEVVGSFAFFFLATTVTTGSCLIAPFRGLLFFPALVQRASPSKGRTKRSLAKSNRAQPQAGSSTRKCRHELRGTCEM